MRLDKLLTHAGVVSRREAGRAVRAGRVTVDGVCVRAADVQVEPAKNSVCFDGVPVEYREHLYLMLNKPAGYISATEDGRGPVVLELLPPALQGRGLFPCGRLDRDTVGLMILTDDGDAAHRRLSPKHHAEKEYAFACERPLEGLDRLEQGIELADGYRTLPCKIRQTGERSGVITLTEGKYHQIKRMFAAVGNHIVFLERIRFAGISLDPALERGEWRTLTGEEQALFCKK